MGLIKINSTFDEIHNQPSLYNAMVFYRNKVVWLGTYLGNFEVIFGQDNEYYESLYTYVTVHTNMRQALI